MSARTTGRGAATLATTTARRETAAATPVDDEHDRRHLPGLRRGVPLRRARRALPEAVPPRHRHLSDAWRTVRLVPRTSAPVRGILSPPTARRGRRRRRSTHESGRGPPRRTPNKPSPPRHRTLSGAPEDTDRLAGVAVLARRGRRGRRDHAVPGCPVVRGVAAAARGVVEVTDTARTPARRDSTRPVRPRVLASTRPRVLATDAGDPGTPGELSALARENRVVLSPSLGLSVQSRTTVAASYSASRAHQSRV